MNYKHGMRRTSLYHIWTGIKARCCNSANPAYANYGGRGIGLCEKWHDFSNFASDMGPRPSKKHSIERKNNEEGYSPNNCVWATRTQQSHNKRNNVLLTIDGETHPLSVWAEKSGLKYSTLHFRISKGWTHEAAIKTPLITRRKGIPRGMKVHAFGAERGVVFHDDERRAA